MKRFLIAVTFAAAVFALVSLAGCSSGESTGGGTDTAATEKVELVLFVREAQPEVADSFEVGQPLRVKDTGTLLGEITDVRSEGSRTAVPDAQGELHEQPSPVEVDIWLTVEGEAVVSDAGFKFGNEFVYVNNDVKYLTPFTQFGGIILEMNVAGE